MLGNREGLALGGLGAPQSRVFALGELLGAGATAQVADMVPAIDFAHGEVGVSGGADFSSITLTTVGYGDLTPQTDAGKIFTVFYVFTGIGIIVGFVNAVARSSFEQRQERKGLADHPETSHHESEGK
jgi:voltage-gated potassium channel Kch